MSNLRKAALAESPVVVHPETPPLPPVPMTIKPVDAGTEPVAWHYVRDTDHGLSFAPDRDPTKEWAPLYTHPLEPVHLTNEEIRRMWYASTERGVTGFARAVEAAVLKANGIGGEK